MWTRMCNPPEAAGRKRPENDRKGRHGRCERHVSRSDHGVVARAMGVTGGPALVEVHSSAQAV